MSDDLDLITPAATGPSVPPRDAGEREPALTGEAEPALAGEAAGPGADEPGDGNPLPEDEAVDGVPVDAMPVLVEARPIAAAATLALPAVQAAAVAATGFVAGAATLALVRRHTARRLARRSAPRRAVDMLPIVGSRTFIVDVHLLAKPGE